MAARTECASVAPMKFTNVARIHGACVESRIFQTALPFGIFDVWKNVPTVGDAVSAGAVALQSGGRIAIKGRILAT